MITNIEFPPIVARLKQLSGSPSIRCGLREEDYLNSPLEQKIEDKLTLNGKKVSYTPSLRLHTTYVFLPRGIFLAQWFPNPLYSWFA